MPNFQKYLLIFSIDSRYLRNICQIVHKYHQIVHKFTNLKMEEQRTEKNMERREISSSSGRKGRGSRAAHPRWRRPRGLPAVWPGPWRSHGGGLCSSVPPQLGSRRADGSLAMPGGRLGSAQAQAGALGSQPPGAGGGGRSQRTESRVWGAPSRSRGVRRWRRGGRGECRGLRR
jgi:hypothetical protein